MKVTKILRPESGKKYRRPLFTATVAAGFPSPADDYIEGHLDLNEHLIKHPAATFFVRVSGDSMQGAGIHSNDLLIVDRAREPSDGSVVIAVLRGEMTVKRIRQEGEKIFLVPENDDYETLEVDDGADFEVWGVVTHVIHEV